MRENIKTLTPYRCARDDYEEGVLLDANENSIGATVAKVSTTGKCLSHALWVYDSLLDYLATFTVFQNSSQWLSTTSVISPSTA